MITDVSCRLKLENVKSLRRFGVLVVHVERPWGLVDFIKQTGRGRWRTDEMEVLVVVHEGRPGCAKLSQGFVGGGV